MKIQYSVRTWISFSFDVPKHMEKLVGMSYKDSTKLSPKDVEKREKYYDELYDMAQKKLLKNKITDFTIEYSDYDEIECDRTF